MTPFTTVITDPILTPQREEKSFSSQVIPGNMVLHADPLLNEITQDQEPQTLLQSIMQEVVDRPARKKQEKMKTGDKSSALSRLVAIAGDDWDASLHQSKEILSTTTFSFTCPAQAGNFPDPDTCSVYYQCAEGVAHRNTCQQGLLWNMAINMCDWENNVDCEVNKGNKEAPPPVEQVASKPFTIFGV